MTDILKTPKEYTLEELKNIRIDLEDVDFKQGWEREPDNKIVARYVPQKELRRVCSYCGNHRVIFHIEGVRFTTRIDLAKTKLYHQTFYLVCKACWTARNIA